jgi:hypothetical protein
MAIYCLLAAHPLKTASEMLYLYAWYLSTLNIVEGLKFFISDTTCNKHANSVSGHSNFFLFFNLASWQIFEDEVFARRKEHKIAKYLALTISIFCLGETLLLGYHSTRQMLYGAAIALMSHTSQQIVWTYNKKPVIITLWLFWLTSATLRNSFDVRSPMFWSLSSFGVATLASISLVINGREKPHFINLD